MNTYIQKYTVNLYAEFDFLLDENYEVGATYQDYISGKWVLLSNEQLTFREAHPDASVQEVFEMKLNEAPEPPVPPVPDNLNTAKQQKLAEIKAQDEFSNKFFVSVLSCGVEVANQELWIDKDLRNSLLNMTLPALQSDGETATKLWTTGTPPQFIEVPISWAMDKLPYVEIYAKRTYDLRASNEAAVYTATTIEEVTAIDVKAGFPLFLTFELNID
jgi:hypothetical protein